MVELFNDNIKSIYKTLDFIGRKGKIGAARYEQASELKNLVNEFDK